MAAEAETLLYPSLANSALSPPSGEVYTYMSLTMLPLSPATTVGQSENAPAAQQQPLFFCVPPNKKLFGYFDTIDDRLFKIRHCMNIEGVVQQLPLFQPPIDPALLVRAAAMGLDIGSILSDLSTPLPFHRFTLMLPRALELCAELKSLGSQLLAALEKQDGEALALLRATQESTVLKAVLDVKQQQVKEAEANKLALQRTRDVTQARFDFYASRAFTNTWEDQQFEGMRAASDLGLAGSISLRSCG